MKTSITIASLLVVAAGAAGVAAALPTQYAGSDTLFNVTRTAITNIGTIGPATSYIGGGSGNGQAAMAAGTPATATQQTAPMSRLTNSGNGVCGFNGGTNGSGNGNTSSIVIGLDAVDVLSSIQSGSQNTAACNAAGNGLAASGTSGVFGSGTQTWKWILALVYGGKDLSTGGVTDCNSTARKNLVQNWSKLFQGGACPFSTTAGATSGTSAASVCLAVDGHSPDGTTGVLWHAFRRDEASGTSDVFSSLIGISPSTSTSALNGFGASPYCNAMNWESTGETTTTTGIPNADGLNGTCTINGTLAASAHDQFTGPGGMLDPMSQCKAGSLSGTVSVSNGSTSITFSANQTLPAGTQLVFNKDSGNVYVLASAISAATAGTLTSAYAGPTAAAATATDAVCGAAGAGNHRMPPQSCTGTPTSGTTPCASLSGASCAAAGCTFSGVWGALPDPSQTSIASDVLPTQMQDNDPIRRPCLGGATNTHTRAGEEVCNIDNQLGLVLPMVDTDWMLNLTPPLAQYPATACNNFKAGKSVGTLTCAPRSGSKHSGECPNGDALIGGACSVPVITGVTSQCVSTAATIAPLHKRTVGNSYGRAFNLQMRDGTFTAPTIGYAQYSIPALGVTEDMAAGYNRIHQVETVLADAAAACQLVDMTDQIGCLTASDPCSIGYAGDAAKSWASRPNPAPGGTDAAGFWANDALQVAAVSPNTTTVQKLGLANEYQLSRKLYFGTLVGFGSIPVGGAADPGTDELTLAKYESISTNIVPILNTFSFFGLGPQAALLTGGAADTPFCEDFNEQVICNPTPTSASTLPANANGCANNPAGIPGGAASPGLLTTCSNGTVEVYEECDDGLNNGTTGDKCSATCRCVHDFNNGTGACNP